MCVCMCVSTRTPATIDMQMPEFVARNDLEQLMGSRFVLVFCAISRLHQYFNAKRLIVCAFQSRLLLLIKSSVSCMVCDVLCMGVCMSGMCVRVCVCVCVKERERDRERREMEGRRDREIQREGNNQHTNQASYIVTSHQTRMCVCVCVCVCICVSSVHTRGHTKISIHKQNNKYVCLIHTSYIIHRTSYIIHHTSYTCWSDPQCSKPKFTYSFKMSNRSLADISQCFRSRISVKIHGFWRTDLRGDVWCVMCDVCDVCDVWCVMYDVWCVMCMMYDVWCMMYDVWCILQINFCNACASTRCTQCSDHVSPGVCAVYDVWCMMYDVWCMMYDVWCVCVCKGVFVWDHMCLYMMYIHTYMHVYVVIHHTSHHHTSHTSHIIHHTHHTSHITHHT